MTSFKCDAFVCSAPGARIGQTDPVSDPDGDEPLCVTVGPLVGHHAVPVCPRLGRGLGSVWPKRDELAAGMRLSTVFHRTRRLGGSRRAGSEGQWKEAVAANGRL
jgi:hypothetical protein